MPSPGGQISGMAGHKRGQGRVDSVWHPIDLHPGLPHGDPGAELPEALAGRVEGCPRLAARSGSARSTGCHSPSVQDRGNPPPRRQAWPGKLLTKNQLLDERIFDRSEPTNEQPPRLHQLLHQRLRTTTNVLGPEPEDKARPRTNLHVVVGAASDYGSHGLAPPCPQPAHSLDETGMQRTMVVR